MAEAGSIPIDIELGDSARALLELTTVHRRFGQLEVAIPTEWMALTKGSPESVPRSQVDAAFLRLHDLMKGRR